MADQRTLTLGTIFTARVDASYTREMRRLRSLILEANKAMGKWERGTKKARKETTKQTTENKKATESFHGFNKQISKVHGGMNRLKAAFKVTAAYGVAARAIFAVVEGIQAGVTEMIEFDQALKNIAAITGATTSELAMMRDIMIEVAERTKFSTTEIAEGMVLLGQSGFTAGEAISAIGAAADLAAGTLTELGVTTDLLTTTVRAFNLRAMDSARVADVMANAINKSKLTLDKIRTSFNFVGAAAAQVGLSIEETAASMALLANNGLRASTIGTGLRQVLSRMIAPNRKLKDAFAEFSIEIDSINPKTQGFEKAMRNLTKVIMKADGVTVDMTKAFSLFGLRGAQAVAVLAKGFAEEKFDQMRDQMFEVGAAAKMAEIQSKGLAFQLKNLSDRAKNFALAIGEAGVVDALRMFIGGLRELVSLFTLIASHPLGQVIIRIGLFTTGVLMAVGAVKLLHIALATKVIPAIKAFTLVLVASPLTWWVAALVAAAIALQLFTSRQQRAIERQNKLNEESKMVVSSLQAYKGALRSAANEIRKNNEVTDRHRALLQRLITDHPELADVIDITTTSYQGYLEVLTKVNEEAEKQAESRVKGIIKSLELNARAIRKEEESIKRQKALTEDRKRLLRSMGEDPEQLRNVDLIRHENEKQTLEKKEISILNELSQAMLGLVEASDSAILTAETFIATEVMKGAITEENAKKLKDVLIPTLKNLIARRKELNEVEGEVQRKESNKERIKAELKYQRLLLSFEENKTKKIEMEHKKRLLDIEKFQEDELARLDKAGKTKVDREATVQAQVNALRAAANRSKESQLENLANKEIKLSNEVLKLEGELYLAEQESQFIGEEKNLYKIANLKREHAIAIAETERTIAQQKLDDILESELATNEEILKARIELLKAEKAVEDAIIADKLGDRKALVKQELEWKKISKSVATKLSEGIAGALHDVADGAKTAKEAFSEMGDSMLSWLSQLIIKQTILNALQSWFPGLFPPTIATTSGQGGVAVPAPPITMHTGGVVGKDIPKFHSGRGEIPRSGLKSNEIPAIIRKDESVFTPAQMSVLGKAIGGSGTQIFNSFEGATFLDKQQMNEAFASLAAQISLAVVGKAASSVIIQDYKDDKPIRGLMRSE